MNGSLVVALVLFEGLDEVKVVKLDAVIGVAPAEEGELCIGEGDLVVVEDGSHSSEGDSSDLGYILVLEEGLQQDAVLTGYFTQTPHQTIDVFLLFLGIGDSVVEVLGTQCGFFLSVLNSKGITGKLKTISRSSQNLA